MPNLANPTLPLPPSRSKSLSFLGSGAATRARHLSPPETAATSPRPIPNLHVATCALPDQPEAATRPPRRRGPQPARPGPHLGPARPLPCSRAPIQRLALRASLRAVQLLAARLRRPGPAAGWLRRHRPSGKSPSPLPLSPPSLHLAASLSLSRRRSSPPAFPACQTPPPPGMGSRRPDPASPRRICPPPSPPPSSVAGAAMADREEPRSAGALTARGLRVGPVSGAAPAFPRPRPSSGPSLAGLLRPLQAGPKPMVSEPA
nr:proline-rich protein 36-like [Aegilops tauschii subsp. strangulata]